MDTTMRWMCLGAFLFVSNQLFVRTQLSRVCFFVVVVKKANFFSTMCISLASGKQTNDRDDPPFWRHGIILKRTQPFGARVFICYSALRICFSLLLLRLFTYFFIFRFYMWFVCFFLFVNICFWIKIKSKSKSTVLFVSSLSCGKKSRNRFYLHPHLYKYKSYMRHNLSEMFAEM